MVKVRYDYITRISEEDIPHLSIDDWLYIQDGQGEHHLYEKSQIQVENENIMFISNDMIQTFNYDDIIIYKVKPKEDIPLWFENQEVNGFENFLIGLLCGVVLMIILSMVV